jgi:hypothetical protein
MANASKSRIIYTQSGLTISGTTTADIKTVQNVTHTLTIPRESVNAFGIEGTVRRPQLDATDATLEFGFIPQTVAGNQGLADITGTELELLREQAIAGDPAGFQNGRAAVIAQGVGALKDALMNSLAVDASVGAMATTTLGFTGVDDSAGNMTAGNPAQNTTVSAMELVGPQEMIVSADFMPTTGDSCIQTASVAWDCPVEVILCLGDDPNAHGAAFGNPPGTASVTVEGLQDEMPASSGNVSATLAVGVINYNIVNFEVDSKTNSLAVGDLFGTFNYVLSGTADGMTIS